MLTRKEGVWGVPVQRKEETTERWVGGMVGAFLVEVVVAMGRGEGAVGCRQVGAR